MLLEREVDVNQRNVDSMDLKYFNYINYILDQMLLDVDGLKLF